ncbi:hypothetical protein N0V94_005802 [Neodidymelliopsis sp. IMI 364377]|nr:hypothetical protein N0V94_005802 [Neodidymelliopsis sp. IMI 364377]
MDIRGTHSEILKILHRHTNEAGAREDQTHWSSIVAAETDISTVFDFAVIESAFVRPHIRPIAYVERLFLQHSTKFRVCLNIEQISTLSFIPAYDDDGARATISRDCGPGSLLIDYAMRYCTSNNHSEDYDGKMASQGKVNQGIVDRFLDAHDYLRHPPAPNMVTEMFGDHEAQQLIDECLYNSLSEEDTLATITRITAQNILKQYQRLLQFCYPPDQKVDELFICGPGARNSCIIDYLEAELPESVITKPLHDIGIPGDAHEAVCYAYLALEAVLEEATHSAAPPPASNSTHPIADIVKATVTPGRRWEELVSQVLEFSDGQRLRIATDVRISGSLEAGVQGMGLR